MRRKAKGERQKAKGEERKAKGKRQKAKGATGLHPPSPFALLLSGAAIRRLQRPYVFLGLWTQGVSLHAVNFEVIAEFKGRYPHIKIGKGSLNFKTTDEFTDAAVKRVLRKMLGS